MDLVVGRVARAHGIRGELVVDIRTDEPDRRFVAGAGLVAVLRSGERRAVTLALVRPHGVRLLVTLEGVQDRDTADTLRGALLVVDSAQLPPPSGPDEFYDHQLEGLTAYLTDGTQVGVVTEVIHGPAGELLVLARGDGAEASECLVPFVLDIVPTVDLEAGRLVLTPPDGLLDPS